MLVVACRAQVLLAELLLLVILTLKQLLVVVVALAPQPSSGGGMLSLLYLPKCANDGRDRWRLLLRAVRCA